MRNYKLQYDKINPSEEKKDVCIKKLIHMGKGYPH